MKMRWWLFVLRIILGIVFIVASVSKLPALSQFATEVAGYNLLPFTLARIYGVALPWVELITGCALILGVFLPFALVMIILMASSFTIANIYAFYQGVNGNCGCFGQLIPLSHTALLIIDAVIILTVAILLFYRNKTLQMTYPGMTPVYVLSQWLPSFLFTMPLSIICFVAPINSGTSPN